VCLCFRCHCIHINFHENRNRPSKVVRGIHILTHRHTHLHADIEQGYLINILLSFQKKESGLNRAPLNVANTRGSAPL
jgi:hypothetical protein